MNQPSSQQPSTDVPPTVREVWTMALWTGLAGGLLEAAIAGARRQWYLPPYVVSPQLVWMIPAVAVAAALVLALVLSVLSLWTAVWRHVRATHVLFAFGMLAAAGPLLTIPRLHWAAVIFAAAGCATQFTRALASKPRTLARGVPWLLGAAVLCTGIVNGALTIREHRRIAALPAARSDAPNVVLLVVDTLRHDGLSLHGNPRPTSPSIDRIATSGVSFESAVATSSWTLPSHSSMFTGQLPNKLTGGWRTPVDATYPTLAEALQSAGYVTGGFAANLVYLPGVYGLDRGFIRYEDMPNTVGGALMSSSLGVLVGTEDHIREMLGYQRVLSRKTATQITDSVLDWVAERQDGKPFFAFANYMDAHEPYLPPEPYASKFGPPTYYEHLIHSSTDAFRPGKTDVPKAVMDADHRSYESGIAYTDAEIGRLVDGLRHRGLLDNTLLIIASDHGEHFGEHLLFGHGNSLYLPLIHVPLIMSFPPRIPAGRKVDTWVTLRDIPATVMDLTGARSPIAFPGVSLAGCWQEGAAAPCSEPAVISQASQRVFGLIKSWYPLSHGNMQSVIAEGYHLISNSNGEEELYLLAADPQEQKNLIGLDEGKAVAARLRPLLPTDPPTP